MDPTEKIIVRLSPETVLVLQALVDRGEYRSLSESVAAAIEQMIESKFTPDEVEKIARSRVREPSLKMESLLTEGNGPESLDEAVRRVVRGYVRSRMDPEE